MTALRKRKLPLSFASIPRILLRRWMFAWISPHTPGSFARRYARTFEIWDGQRLDALMAAYFNEDLGQIFISHLCTARARSGKGLGSLLMNQLKRYGNPYRVIRLEVRKDNLRARAFYARHGFSPERETEERLTLICPLNICQPGISPPDICPQSTSSSSSSAACQP